MPGDLGRRYSSLVVLYCLGLPISLEEAMGTGLDILEASVRIDKLLGLW